MCTIICTKLRNYTCAFQNKNKKANNLLFYSLEQKSPFLFYLFKYYIHISLSQMVLKRILIFWYDHVTCDSLLAIFFFFWFTSLLRQTLQVYNPFAWTKGTWPNLKKRGWSWVNPFFTLSQVVFFRLSDSGPILPCLEKSPLDLAMQLSK